ncbi:hypothetical protein [Chryseobacterium sp.]|uniref:hypothetical protein n=1 Tax=Chryseobacterium sp. TaxID=1871047 RepID=UPI0011CC190D|nr:hypothetical protein [Chryseobacterium sp.]TXF77663.1 hypothetical protein FUA25_06975 [Chryseobacterium sp.]
MNPIFHFAQGFYDIAYNAAYRNKIDGTEKGFQRLPTAVINFNFSAELYLKGLHTITTKLIINGHELWKLFKYLSPEIKSEIEELYNNFLETNKDELSSYKAKFIVNNIEPLETRESDNLKNMLLVHNKSFEEWRYLYENKKSIIYEYDFNKMDCFIKSLITVINKIQKK